MQGRSEGSYVKEAIEARFKEDLACTDVAYKVIEARIRSPICVFM